MLSAFVMVYIRVAESNAMLLQLGNVPEEKYVLPIRTTVIISSPLYRLFCKEWESVVGWHYPLSPDSVRLPVDYSPLIVTII